MKAKKPQTPLEFYLENKQLQQAVNAADNFSEYCAQLQRELFPAFAINQEQQQNYSEMKPLDLEEQIEEIERQNIRNDTDNIAEFATDQALGSFEQLSQDLTQRLGLLFDTNAFDAHISAVSRSECVEPAVVSALTDIGDRFVALEEMARRIRAKSDEKRVVKALNMNE